MNTTIDNLEEKIQIEALKLGYKRPDIFESTSMLSQILQENKKRPTPINAQKYLEKNRNFLDNKIYLYWLIIAKKLKK
jgi:hypothetical protein